MEWVRAAFTPDELRFVLASTSICFDLSVFEIFATLSTGGVVVLAENALELPRLESADAVTLVNTVPSAIAELLRTGGIPSSVQTVNLAGEPLLAPLVDSLYALPNIRKVCDLYGPSEDTTYSTYAVRERGGPETIGGRSQHRDPSPRRSDGDGADRRSWARSTLPATSSVAAISIAPS